MKLLAFETATEACSVALWCDGEVRERFEVAPRRHAELALPWAEALLAEAGVARSQLDAIAVGRGPGAFTGVRLAVAIAQGIGLALDRPVLPVSTLAALAMQADADGENILAAIDARMGEVYFGTYRRSGDDMSPLWNDQLSLVEGVAGPDGIGLPASAAGRWIGVGTGFAAAGGLIQKKFADVLLSCDPAALPHAADVARLAANAWARGEAIAPELVEPAYLRDRVALTSLQQQAARAQRDEKK